ncbi:universal stress protein [Benzoatithermus flavus]|uniref:Universal stress protein n=1 Tax=Benzoatithermus flavus TaxID=3108223 RepID=A0ABU8XXM2_9PROT
MAYRTILLELVDDVQNEARILCGRRLAERFDAELVGIHVSLPPFVPVGYGEGAAYVGPEIFEAQREANRLIRERVEATFRRLCDPARMAVRDLYEEGDPGTVIAEAARGADLVLAAQESVSGLDALAPQPIDHVILSAGGPVLMLPRQGLPETIGRRVVVAWNGSREAARALKDALPFLVTADAVMLVAGGEDAARSLDAATALLKRHAAPVQARQLPAGSSAGAMLLEAAAVESADLLVMGAYGHSRLREIVLGGATREVLRRAGLPVLFSC